MGCIEVKPARHRGGVTRRNPDRRLRPMVMAAGWPPGGGTTTLTRVNVAGNTASGNGGGLACGILCISFRIVFCPTTGISSSGRRGQSTDGLFPAARASARDALARFAPDSRVRAPLSRAVQEIPGAE